MTEHSTLSGKAALVTGAGRGIGRAIAVALAGEGAAVALVARTPQQLAETRDEIRGRGGAAETFPADISRDEEIRHLAADVKARFGRLDILVNNAAIVRKAPLAETATADWDEIMAVNARGAFILTREVLPLLRADDRSWIVNIASAYAFRPGRLEGPYSASKHALLGFSKTIARETAAGVRVHVVYPGGTDTVMRPDANRDSLIRPAAVAEAVLYLLSLPPTCSIDELYLRRRGTTPFV